MITKINFWNYFIISSSSSFRRLFPTWIWISTAKEPLKVPFSICKFCNSSLIPVHVRNHVTPDTIFTTSIVLYVLMETSFFLCPSDIFLRYHIRSSSSPAWTLNLFKRWIPVCKVFDWNRLTLSIGLHNAVLRILHSLLHKYCVQMETDSLIQVLNPLFPGLK